MAKHSKQKTESQLTKKQIAHSRRQRQQNIKVYIGLGVVAVLIIAVAIVGVYDNLIARPSRAVAVVNGVSIKSGDYQDRVLYERFLLDQLLQGVQLQLANLDTSDPNSEFLMQYYQQAGNQVYQQRMMVDQSVVDRMVEEELAAQKAKEIGETVSPEEIDEALRSQLASRMGYVTQEQATAIASTVEAVTATAESFTPTPIPTPEATEAADESGEDATTEENPTTPMPTPTLHVFTDDEFHQEYQAYADVIRNEAGTNEAQLRAYTAAELLTDKVAEWFAEQVPLEAEQVDVSHIQVETDDQAQLVMDRLDAGENFAVVASQVSSDTFTAEEGGSLGWMVPEDVGLRFGQEVQLGVDSLEVGAYSKPITSTLGWQIVKLNDRGVQPLDASQLRRAQQKAYDDWLEEALNSEGVQILWEKDLAPPDPLMEQTAAGLPTQ